MLAGFHAPIIFVLSFQDKKSVENCCICFCRLVDNFQTDQRTLKEIAVHGLLTNIQQLLVVSPSVISTSTFVMVIRMLSIMCASCPDLAVVLLKQSRSATVHLGKRVKISIRLTKTFIVNCSLISVGISFYKFNENHSFKDIRHHGQ